MKIAILSDIHANLEALTIVLNKCLLEKIDTYFFLGDYVGYYFQPNEVIQKIKSLNGYWIRGNHEELLKEANKNKVYLDEITSKYGIGIKKAIKELSEENFDWIKSLEVEKIIELDGVKFHLSHGSPIYKDKYLYPDSSEEDFEDSCRSTADVILVGHSHYPFIKQIKNKIVINPGSVGQAKDIGGLASWGIYDTSNLTFTLKKTMYNVEKLIYEIDIMETENKDYLCKILKKNRQWK